MKISLYAVLAICFIGLSSCVTGNDDNDTLRDLEEQFAATPRVTNLTVDGVAPSRDRTSHWLDFEVRAGDQVAIVAVMETGVGASSSTFDISRTYHNTHFDEDSAAPVEPMTEREVSYGAGSNNFSLTYTIPTMDDDGEAFQVGDHINITFWSSNDLRGQGFTDINFIYVE